MTVVIGVLLGASFTPDLLRQAPLWLPSVAGLVVFMLACSVLCVAFFRKVGGFDRTTAYFAGMPGGLVEMVTVGEEKGGDGRMIALVHSARILLVVLSLPFIVQWIEGVPLGGRRTAGISILDTPIASDVWLIVCGLVGIFIGQILRLPAKYLLGPMLATCADPRDRCVGFLPSGRDRDRRSARAGRDDRVPVRGHAARAHLARAGASRPDRL